MPTAYITAPPDAAERLANDLVERRLAACVNLVETRSIYRWDESIHDDEEVVLLAKTTDDRYDALVEYVERTHPYEVPCLERFEDSDALASFVDWRKRVTDDGNE